MKLPWLLALAVAAGSSTRAQVSRQDSFRDVYHLSGLGVVGQAIAGETSCGPNPSGVREVMLLKSIDGPGAARLEWRPGTDGSCEAFLHLLRPDGSETIIAVPASIRVAASDEVVEAVERVVGSGMLSFR